MKGNTGRAVKRRTQRQELDATSNQWQSNPKQQRFLKNYFDPKSNTFGNVFQSAVSAGYKESYARTLTRQSNKNMWISDFMSKISLTPDHITQGISNIAIDHNNRTSDRLKGYELLGKMQGLFIDKQINATVNLEQAINDLK